MNKKIAKAIAIFAISYLTIIIISEMNNNAENKLPLRHIDFSTFPTKADYTTILMPIIGFFFVYLIMPYLTKEFGFGKKFIKYIFPIGFITFSIIGFYLAVYAYYLDIAFRLKLGFDLSRFNLDYWGIFLGSPFIYFIIAGLFGWIAHMIIEKFKE